MDNLFAPLANDCFEEKTALNTDVTIIKTIHYGEAGCTYGNGKVTSRERIVTLNDKIIYRELQTWPQFQNDTQIGATLHDLEKQLSFGQQRQSTEKSRGNTRNFIQPIKFIWAKLFAKIINFKS